MIEQRRYARATIDAPVTFSVKGNPDPFSGLAKDVSLGGMFIETPTPAAFGASVVVQVVLRTKDGPVALPGLVRWVRDGGMGIQFGLLGARETHLITELGRSKG